MTEELHDLLSGRAERAHTPHDPDHVVTQVATRAERRTRNRRNRLAVASGTVVVVVAAVVGIAVADPDGTDHAAGRSPHQQVGATGGVPVSSRNPADAVELPVLRPHLKRAAIARRQRMSEREAAARALERRQRESEKQARAHSTLVQADPAPTEAEISLGLVPRGFGYLSGDDADTFYGPTGLLPRRYFSRGIVVDVRRVAGSFINYTHAVDGKPAAYYGSADRAVAVRIRYGKRIDIGFQLPDDVHLTEAQALQMASALDVRSTKHATPN